MSSVEDTEDFHVSEITLIERKSNTIDIVPIDGDNLRGNLTEYRLSSRLNATLNGTTKNGHILLRGTDGLFDTKGPILTNEAAKAKYLIEAQLSQNWRETGKKGRLFRFELTDANTGIGDHGRHVSLTLTALDVRLDEFRDSEQLRLYTPFEAFKRRLATFNAGRSDDNDALEISLADSDNDLPNDDRLRQDWLPLKPMTTKMLLVEIIRRVSSPTVIGSGNEDWYYEITPVEGGRPGQYKCIVKRFGHNTTPIVKLDVDSARTSTVPITVAKEINSNFNNRRYKNIVIGECKKGAHSYPMNFTRAASDITHGRIAEDYSTTEANYRIGDYVKSGTDYFKCKANTTAANPSPPSSLPLIWDKIVPRDASTSPWTEDLEWWTDNMSPTTDSDYVGLFHDMNIVRKRYDLTNVFDEFEGVSIKDVEGILRSPPASKKHGQRWLVDSITLSGNDWNSHEKQIAQWNTAKDGGAGWEFSSDPVTDELVTDRGTGEVLRYDNSSWITEWSLAIEGALTSESHSPIPFIPVEAISHEITGTGRTVANGKLIRARDNSDDRAVFFKFNWNVFPNEADTIVSAITEVLEIISPFHTLLDAGFELLGHDISDSLGDIAAQFANFLSGNSEDNDSVKDDFGVGSLKNRASRRFGYSITFPFGDTDNHVENSTVDFINMNYSMRDNTKIGWQNGEYTEDLGNVRGLEQWLFLRHENNAGEEINGIANVPMVYWFRDLFDRVVFFEYTIRAHNTWQKSLIPCGPGSNVEQFDSRIDEFFKAFGYTFPFNFYIKERELTGALFNWNFVRGMGTFNKQSYSDNFIYTAGQDSFLKIFAEHALQYVVKNPAVYTAGLIEVEKVITDNVIFGVDDIHFLKDGYVTFNSGANYRGSEVDPDPTAADSIIMPIETNPRMDMIPLTNQFDYVNIKDILRRQLSRFQYHPEKQIVESRGDVRLNVGETFSIQKPDSDEAAVLPQNFVPMEVSHIEKQGYNCVITAIRKYQPEASDV